MKKIIKLDGRYLKIDESNLVCNEYDATDFNDVSDIQIVKSDSRLYSIVHGKIDWVIIDISYSNVTLMSLNVLGDIQYAYPMIVESGIQDINYSTSWKDSIVRHICEFNKYNFLGDYTLRDATRIPTKEEVDSLPMNLRIAHLLSGCATTYWTSTAAEDGCIWYVTSGGKCDYTFPDRSRGFRPVVTLSQYVFDKMERDWSEKRK